MWRLSALFCGTLGGLFVWSPTVLLVFCLPEGIHAVPAIAVGLALSWGFCCVVRHLSEHWPRAAGLFWLGFAQGVTLLPFVLTAMLDGAPRR